MRRLAIFWHREDLQNTYEMLVHPKRQLEILQVSVQYRFAKCGLCNSSRIESAQSRGEQARLPGSRLKQRIYRLQDPACRQHNLELRCHSSDCLGCQWRARRLQSTPQSTGPGPDMGGSGNLVRTTHS